MNMNKSSDYVPFAIEDYVDNPVALTRINAGITQEKLAKRMKVTLAYIGKLEGQSEVSAKVLKKVKAAIKKRNLFEELEQGVLEIKAHKRE
jgi:predicted transcriptional regulator